MRQKGTIYPLTLLLLAVMGLISFLAITTFLPFKNTLFSSIYPKQSSQAASNPDSTTTNIVITNPTNGSILNPASEVIIQTLTSGNIEVSKVAISINGELFCTVDSPPFECAWRVPSVKNTSYTILAQTFDKDGKISSTEVMVKSN